MSGCAQQSNFKVRDMAARALVPLVPSQTVAPFLAQLLESCPATPGAAFDRGVLGCYRRVNSPPADLKPGVFNMLHGKMCQLRYLVQANVRSSIVVDGALSLALNCNPFLAANRLSAELYRRVLPLMQQRLWFFSHVASASLFMFFEAMADLSSASPSSGMSQCWKPSHVY